MDNKLELIIKDEPAKSEILLEILPIYHYGELYYDNEIQISSGVNVTSAMRNNVKRLLKAHKNQLPNDIDHAYIGMDQNNRPTLIVSAKPDLKVITNKMLETTLIHCTVITGQTYQFNIL